MIKQSTLNKMSDSELITLKEGCEGLGDFYYKLATSYISRSECINAELDRRRLNNNVLRLVK